MAIVAWALGGARTPWEAFRRLALPGSAMLIAAHLAGLLPLPGAIALVAGWSLKPALVGPLLLLMAVFCYSLAGPA